MYHPASGTMLIKDGQSGQLTELVAIQMAVQSATAHDKTFIHILTDSWEVANRIEYWSDQWQQDNFPIQGHPIWAAPI